MPYGRLAKHKIPLILFTPFTLGLSQCCCLLPDFLTRPNCNLFFVFLRKSLNTFSMCLTFFSGRGRFAQGQVLSKVLHLKWTQGEQHKLNYSMCLQLSSTDPYCQTWWNKHGQDVIRHQYIILQNQGCQVETANTLMQLTFVIVIIFFTFVPSVHLFLIFNFCLSMYFTNSNLQNI